MLKTQKGQSEIMYETFYHLWDNLTKDSIIQALLLKAVNRKASDAQTPYISFIALS